MPATATILCIVFLALSIGWRGFVQYRRNGDFGFRRPPSDAGAREKVAGLLVLGGVAGLLLSPVLALAGLTSPLPDLDSVPIRSLGLVLACTGIALTVIAEFQMGDSWRIGVDPAETTELVSNGLYTYVRNPIYTGMLLFALGLVMLVPSLLALLSLLSFASGIRLHVRGVEEPHLMRKHHESYSAYARRTGRFLPGIGRM